MLRPIKWLGICIAAASAARRLEPNGTLHMAGQSGPEFVGYRDFLPPNSRPLAYTTYHSLHDLNASDGGVYFDKFRALLDQQLGDSQHVVLPHISLALTPGNTTLDLVNSGAYDFAISTLVQGLPRLGRPVFLRIGYEFNGHWNGYEPNAYVKAWRRIEAAIAKNSQQRARTALVWDMTCDETGNRTDWKLWFPGEEQVDWFGVNVFQFGRDFNSMPNSSCVLDFVAAAEAQRFPVLVAEAMPRYIGTNSNSSYVCRHQEMHALCNVSSWNGWFEPFFSTLLARPAVKGFSYIDRDCLAADSDSEYSAWSEARRESAADATTPHKCVGGQWGDARLETSPASFSQKYKAALAAPGAGIVHAASLKATCARLGIVGADVCGGGGGRVPAP